MRKCCEKKLPPLPGKTEIDIFKNFFKEKGDYLRDFAAQLELSSKDDHNSFLITQDANQDYQDNKYYTCLEKCTESLLHATYNSKAYAEALKKRSVIYFDLQYYNNCANDLSLCLQADYPAPKKPRLYMEKANCYAQMRNLKKMLESIDDCYNFMKNCPEISDDLMADYLKEIKTFRELNDFNLENIQLVQPLLNKVEIKERHPQYINVSSSINISFNNTSESYYTAVRDIPYGEVLFIENAYSHGLSTSDGILFGVFFCDFCLEEAKNCIPCRTCVKLLYCSENCRVKAWNDYHQWECDIIRANFLPDEMILSLRTVIKAACSGSIKEIVSKKSIKPGKNTDPYLNIYSLFVDFGDLRVNHNDGLILCCQNSVIMVEFLKKSTFISHLMSSTLRNVPFDEVVDLIGGALLRHNIQALQKSISLNSNSSILKIVDEPRHTKLALSCMRIIKFNVFCPMVSGVPYSCLPNINIEFQGYTAIVKASRDIKAGERIYRSTHHLSPKISHTERKLTLEYLMISCNCESCKDTKKNCDFYNTFICTACGGNAVLENLTSPSVACLDCNTNNSSTMILQALGRYDLAKVSGDLSTKINCLENLKSIANPHHQYIYKMYKSILQLRSLKVSEDTNEFKKALEDLKNCSKTRNKYGDPYHYLQDIIVICQAFFDFLPINKANITVEEGRELLDILSELIEEAKEISVVTFPPFLELFVPLQVYLLRFRIVHIYLKV